MVAGLDITDRQFSLDLLAWRNSLKAACEKLFENLKNGFVDFGRHSSGARDAGIASSAASVLTKTRSWLQRFKEGPSSPNSLSLCNDQSIGTAPGNVRRDELGRIREIRGAMMVSYADPKTTPNIWSPIDTILYIGLAKRSIVRQSDGTYNLYEHPNGSLFMTAIPLALDQRTGIVSGVNPRTGTTILIPPSAPILLQIDGADDGADWMR